LKINIQDILQEKNKMIKSVFDLCLDIQEKIGDELKPLVQSKVLKQLSINECHEKMKLNGFLMMEDHVFKRNIRRTPANGFADPIKISKDYKQNIGRMYLKIMKMEKQRPYMFKSQSLGFWKTHTDLMKSILPDYSYQLNQICTIISKNRLTLIDTLVNYGNINLFGLSMKSVKYTDKRYIIVLRGEPVIISSVDIRYSKITHFVLDNIARDQGFPRWRTSWNKDRKIHRLIHEDL